MNITGLKTFLCNPTGEGRNWIYVKIYTDGGIEGVGEAFNTGKDKATESVIHDYGRWLLGKDPTRIVYHWQAIYRSSRFPLGTVSMGALSAVEHALWDITGKKYGVPVYKLLGGHCRDKIRVYTHVHGGTPEELAANASAVVNLGYTAIKFGPHPPDYLQKNENIIVRDAYDRVKAVRDAVGEGVDICLDYHGTEFSPSNAVRLARALEPLKPLFLEEPVLHENVDAMVEVKSKTTIPIASGERLFTRYGFRELIEKRAVDIVQPDPIVCGGILETIRIASEAETRYLTVAPHNPFSPIATAVCVHIDACAPNFLIQEYIPDEVGARRDVVVKPLRLEKGYLLLPDEPGLGVELNEDGLGRYPFKHWDREVAFKEDGSIGLV